MPRAATVPIWSVDDYLNLQAGNHHVLSRETVGRVESFAEAYVLYDIVVLPARYRADPTISDLDDGCFSYIEREGRLHSDALHEGVTIDLDTSAPLYDQLERENDTWWVLHNPDIDAEMLTFMRRRGRGIDMALLRLWQWSSTLEAARLRDAAMVLPPSLQSIVAGSAAPATDPDYLEERYREFVRKTAATVARLYSTQEAETHEFGRFPLLTMLLVDMAQSREHAVEVLRLMRRDYAELRAIRSRYETDLASAVRVSDFKQATGDWNSAWEKVVGQDFRRPQLFSRTVQTADVVDVAVDPAKGILKVLLRSLLEHRDYSRAWRRFSVFTNIREDFDGVDRNLTKFRDVFGVQAYLTGR